MMRKGKGFRGPKRRGFDDEGPFPDDLPSTRPSRPAFGAPASREMALPEGPVVDATVKWFNPEKGFGFAELADGSGDAFLHAAVLQQAGHDSVSPGAKLKVQVGRGAKGPQITKLMEIDETDLPAQAPPRRSLYGGGSSGGPGGAGQFRRTTDPSSAVEMVGTVKWFNAEKGFGFVACDDGGKDVFLHVSVLERSGLAALGEGQAVTMRVVDTPKGREAVAISLSD
jgi:cold shock protein